MLGGSSRNIKTFALPSVTETVVNIVWTSPKNVIMILPGRPEIRLGF